MLLIHKSKAQQEVNSMKKSNEEKKTVIYARESRDDYG